MQRVWTALGLSAVFGLSLPARDGPAKSAEQILHSYVQDFRHDPAAAEPITFGVRVTGQDGGDWHVVVAPKNEDADTPDVRLKTGLPPEPSPCYTLDLPTLRKIDAGQMNALTAMSQAHGHDPTPMGFETMPGFQGDAGFLARFLPFTFHFWTRGFPERVPFHGRLSRVVHGVNVVTLYYEKGLRSAWMQIEKGQHCNQDPGDQTNPFASMFIMLRGRAEARIGGQQSTFPAGQMMFVPAGVAHEFWNPRDQPAEVIILMFGQGA